ncbi:hypothetical protein [Verrucomicrobium spinosum]|uniref:hypothetical protein n=1 Tax=Verrucomicrobium spinosum TaxID=2736 RepID=UPI0012E107D9|nr:hypothetical protein [Verrucomicrobium spinosum]
MAQDHEERERRRDVLRAILRSAWQDLRTSKWTRTLRAAFANLTVLAAEDRALLAWITQTEFARGFVETRAAMCARRKRRVRVPLELNGYSGLTAPGGKSESAIATYSKVQEGNKNRAGAVEESLDALWEKEKARKVLREHSHIPRRPGLPTDPRALKAFLKREQEAAELRRLTKLFPEIAGAELGKSDLETDNDHE